MAYHNASSGSLSGSQLSLPIPVNATFVSADGGGAKGTDGVVRWRCVDVREQILRRYSVVLHERTVGKLLRRFGLTRLQPRPYHPKQDVAAQEAFKKVSPSW